MAPIIRCPYCGAGGLETKMGVLTTFLTKWLGLRWYRCTEGRCQRHYCIVG